MSFINDLSALIDHNEGTFIAAIIVSGVVSVILGSMTIYTRQLRIMAEHGYIEVQGPGTTSTHWEKAK